MSFCLWGEGCRCRGGKKKKKKRERENQKQVEHPEVYASYVLLTSFFLSLLLAAVCGCLIVGGGGRCVFIY